MALFNVLFDIAAKTASFESSMTRIERRFDSVASYAKKAGAVMGIAFGAEMFREGILGAVELGDEMGKLADKTGLTASAASQLARVFKQNDLDNETLTNSFRKMQVELSKGSIVFKQLGLSAEDLKRVAPDKAFEIIAKRINEIVDPADRARAAIEIFGKTGTELLPVMKQNIAELRKELGGLSDSDIARLQNADEAFKKLSMLKESFWSSAAVAVERFAESIHLIKPEALDPLQGKLADVNAGVERTQKLIDELTLRRTRAGALRIADEDVGDAVVRAGRSNLNIKQLREAMTNLIAEREKLNNAIADAAKKPVSDPDLCGNTTPAAEKVAQSYAKQLEQWNQLTMTEGERALAQFESQTAAIDKLLKARAITVEVAGHRNMAAWEQYLVLPHSAMKVPDIEMPDFIDREKIERDIEDFNRGLGKSLGVYEEAEKRADAITNELHRSITSAFSDMFYNLGSGANSFADDMVNAFKRVLANAATMQLFDLLAQLGSDWKTKGDSGSANGGGNGWMSAVGGFLGSIFGRAGGGSVNSGRAYLVGEQGPELFMPGMSGGIVPNHQLAGGGFTYSLVFNVDARGATQDAVKLLPSAMKQASDDAVSRMLQMRQEGRF